MKFTCSKNDLSEALQTVSRAVANKPQMPILSGVYIRAEGSTLEMQANNFSLGIIAKTPVNTEEPGELVVVGKYFLEIVRKLSGDAVTISYEPGESVVNIQSESASFNLMAMSPEDFPKVKSQEVVTSFKIRAGKLKNLIRKTAFACSTDEVRPIFTGCLFEIGGTSVTVAATNTHRLSIVRDQLAEEVAELRFVVPAGNLRDLMRMLESSAPENPVTVDYCGKYMSFTFDNIFMTSRLIEGQFPPYDKVIPSSSETFVTANVAELLSAVDRVALISKETEYNTIRFIFSQNGIEISSTSPEVGKASEHVACTIEGPDLDISFNVAYIFDVLKALDGAECRIALNQRLSPADIREAGNDNFIYVVTPVRT